MRERLLAPRVISFRSNQVFWECSCLKACETYPGEYELNREAIRIWTLGGRNRKATGLPLSGRNRPVSLKDWHYLIKEYTVGELTKERDKLVAISAVAKRFATLLELDISTYRAGLWLAILPGHLLWYRYEGL
jgi:hypothetical protein